MAFISSFVIGVIIWFMIGRALNIVFEIAVEQNYKPIVKALKLEAGPDAAITAYLWPFIVFFGCFFIVFQLLILFTKVCDWLYKKPIEKLSRMLMKQ
jgi:hypothetical protein